MRLKFQSVIPLPQFKIWFNFHPDQLNSVAHLKRVLVHDIPPLHDANIVPDAFVLDLDGFHLLDSSDIDVLRDGDLILLKHLPHSTTNEKKRPFAFADPVIASKSESAAKKQRVERRFTKPLPLSSSSSSPSSSSSSSSSSSDSSSDESSSAPSVHPTNTRTVPGPYSGLQNKNATPKPPVPPGQGSSATQQRNARRRLKRAIEKATAPTPTITPSIAANLHNKNKRKGFKQAMNGQTPQRIVFDEHEKDEAPLPAPTPERVQARLIPPSERTDIPPNIIVTSIDVEADLPRTRRKKEQHQHQPTDEADVTFPYADASMMEVESFLDAERDSPTDGIDWDGIDSTFDALTKVDASSEIPLDSLLAWKELDIDPTTLSPQMMLKLGKLHKKDGTSCHIMQLTRPGLGAVSFGALQEEDEGEDGENELVLQIEEMIQADWRIVQCLPNGIDLA